MKVAFYSSTIAQQWRSSSIILSGVSYQESRLKHPTRQHFFQSKSVLVSLKRWKHFCTCKCVTSGSGSFQVVSSLNENDCQISLNVQKIHINAPTIDGIHLNGAGDYWPEKIAQVSGNVVILSLSTTLAKIMRWVVMRRTGMKNILEYTSMSLLVLADKKIKNWGTPCLKSHASTKRVHSRNWRQSKT